MLKPESITLAQASQAHGIAGLSVTDHFAGAWTSDLGASGNVRRKQRSLLKALNSSKRFPYCFVLEQDLGGCWFNSKIAKRTERETEKKSNLLPMKRLDNKSGFVVPSFPRQAGAYI